jgi:hypothetical protein
MAGAPTTPAPVVVGLDQTRCPLQPGKAVGIGDALRASGSRD